MSFITKLYALVEYCEYGALREEMIRDCLVVVLLDATLSKKLQLDPDLTLEKAIAKVHNAETVKSQQAVVRGEDASNMDSPIGTIGKGKPRQEQRIRREAKILIVGSHLEAHHQHVIDMARHLHMNGKSVQQGNPHAGNVVRVTFKRCVGRTRVGEVQADQQEPS